MQTCGFRGPAQPRTASARPFHPRESVREASPRLRRARDQAVPGGRAPAGGRRGSLPPPDAGTRWDRGPGSRAPPGASGLHRGRRWSRTGREAVGRQTWRNNYRGEACRGNGIGRRGSPPSEAVRGGGRDPRRGEAARAGARCRGPEPARVQGWREGPEALGGAFRAPGSGSDALRFPLRREPPFRELFRNSCRAVAGRHVTH